MGAPRRRPSAAARLAQRDDDGARHPQPRHGLRVTLAQHRAVDGRAIRLERQGRDAVDFGRLASGCRGRALSPEAIRL